MLFFVDDGTVIIEVWFVKVFSSWAFFFIWLISWLVLLIIIFDIVVIGDWIVLIVEDELGVEVCWIDSELFSVEFFFGVEEEFVVFNWEVLVFVEIGCWSLKIFCRCWFWCCCCNKYWRCCWEVLVFIRLLFNFILVERDIVCIWIFVGLILFRGGVLEVREGWSDCIVIKLELGVEFKICIILELLIVVVEILEGIRNFVFDFGIVIILVVVVCVCKVGGLVIRIIYCLDVFVFLVVIVWKLEDVGRILDIDGRDVVKCLEVRVLVNIIFEVFLVFCVNGDDVDGFIFCFEIIICFVIEIGVLILILLFVLIWYESFLVFLIIFL